MAQVAAQHVAQIRYHKEARRLEVTVPKGTLPSQTARLNDTLTKDIIPRLTGHTGCFSGLDFFIHEELGDVVRVDLESGRVG